MTAGIVHLGLGAFHRSHQAVYTEDAMRLSGDHGWGIIGAATRSDVPCRVLDPQDGLYTVDERGKDSSTLRVVSSLLGTIHAPAEPHRLVAAIAATHIQVVTLTVSEKGYSFHPSTGRLDAADPRVAADLTGAGPTTPVGQIVRGLQARMRADSEGITVLSCDNLPENGVRLASLVSDFVDQLPRRDADELQEWIAGNVTFPSSMVDRITPATTDTDRADIGRRLGLRDEAAVVAEPFRQWVIEDRFAGRRPAWEQAGAQLVDDVRPWEQAKLRMLNASHSLLAYLGLAAGMPTIAQAADDADFSAACRAMMLEDVMPVLDRAEGLDPRAYADSLLTRFRNPALRHTTGQVGSDGSLKLGPRVLSTVLDQPTGRTAIWSALTMAAWIHAVREGLVAADPHLNAVRESASATPVPDRVTGVLERSGLFDGRVSADRGFVEAVTHWYSIIAAGGLPAVRTEIRTHAERT